MFKVPFRAIYTDTLVTWAKTTFWCHVVVRVFPEAIDIESDVLVGLYIEDPLTFYEQYAHRLRRIEKARQKRE